MKKILIYGGLTALLLAGEDGFDLAPTPVSQNQVKEGEVEKMFRVTSISSSVDTGGENFSMAGVGAQLAKKEGEYDGAVNISGSILTLSGSGGGLTASLISANAAFLWEKYEKTQEGVPYTIFYGGDFSYTYANAYDDYIETDIYLMLYGGTIGIQYNINSEGMIFSPFAVAKYLMGTYEADVWLSDYYGTYVHDSNAIDPMLTRAFGFDIYFKSLGSTLSAMIKNDSASSTTMLSYSWNL